MRRNLAALYLSMPLSTFDALRIKPTVVLGCVLFDIEDLNAWASGLKRTEDWLSKLDEADA